MPARYDIVPAYNLLYVVGFGRCTGADYLDVNRAALGDPRRRPNMDTIIDMHGLTSFSITMDELQEIVAEDRRLKAAGVYGDRFRTALVIRSEEEETIGHLYNALVRSEGMGVHTFYRLGGAIDWLGLEAARTDIEARRERLTGRAA